MTRPLSELDVAYLAAHEQSRRIHRPPRPLPTPDEIRAAHGRLVALSRALSATARVMPAERALTPAEARHAARGFTHPADTD